MVGLDIFLPDYIYLEMRLYLFYSVFYMKRRKMLVGLKMSSECEMSVGLKISFEYENKLHFLFE